MFPLFSQYVGYFKNSKSKKNKGLFYPRPHQNTLRDPVGDSAPVPGRIVFQRGGERLSDLRRGQQRHPELRPEKAAGGVALAGEGSEEGPRFEGGDQCGRLDVHAGELRVGEQPGPVVKNGAVAVSAVLLEDGDIVEVPVVVGEQCIHLKEQRQIPGKVREACAVRRGFRQVSDPPPVAGKPRQLVPQRHSYYNLMLTGRRIVDGVFVLDAEYLVAFKAKAWLDLTA